MVYKRGHLNLNIHIGYFHRSSVEFASEGSVVGVAEVQDEPAAQGGCCGGAYRENVRRFFDLELGSAGYKASERCERGGRLTKM